MGLALVNSDRLFVVPGCEHAKAPRLQLAGGAHGDGSIGDDPIGMIRTPDELWIGPGSPVATTRR
jgi:hypothetical protein